MNHLLTPPSTRVLAWLMLGLAILFAAPVQAQDSKLKSWTTAEMLGAMRWAKAETPDRRERLDYSAAELICYRRLQKQIESGAVSRGGALLIAENVRKTGIYRRQKLTLKRADELRRGIVAGRIFESIVD
jgi:hypothetical protein